MRLLFLAMVLTVACRDGGSADSAASGSEGIGRCRPAVYAGGFYPADPAALAGMVDSLLALSGGTPPEGEIIAGVVPHAGYVYSGETAAALYGALEGGDIDIVILVGPSHQVPLNGFSVFQGSLYMTPLGEVPVDAEVAERLLGSHPSAEFVPAAHEAEHCLEVQLPFLQRVLAPGFAVVPVLVGEAREDDLRFMAELILAEACARRVLLIASCDLSHYPDLETAMRVDSMTVGAVLEGDVTEFLETTSRQRLPDGLGTFACGRQAVALAMAYAEFYPGAGRELLSMSTSADYSGDSSRVVGYASMAFTSAQPDPGEWRVTEDSSRLLLELARSSVESSVLGLEMVVTDGLPEELELPRGAFVTLKRNGELRGCIGSIRPLLPLGETVVTMARSAALEDPRFIPVAPAELPELDYEISVLTPLQILEDPDLVRVGTDGLLILAPDGRSGVLLPQVPVEQGWDREEFLQRVCLKAGLPPDAYLGNVTIYRFQAQILEGNGDEARETQ